MQNNYYTTAATPQRGGAAGYDMNHLYLSPSQQQVNRQGMFLKRTERIDWRRIGKKIKSKDYKKKDILKIVYSYSCS